MRKIFLILTLFSIFSCVNKKEKTSTELEMQKEFKKNNSDSLDIQIPKDEIGKDSLAHHYICYLDNETSSIKIWISFTEKDKAIGIKYKGQTDSIQLIFDKEEYIEGGAHPTIIKYYSELYNGKVNGIYKLTHSGNWDYVEYTRGKDGKIFNFTIDHNSDPYGKKPCF